jgi:hypothetical protein
VTKVFSTHRQTARVDIDVNVAVGVTVPRRVNLVAIPQDVLVIVPEWRGYRYFIVDDRVCIVDPDTYVIVHVIVLA